MRRKNERKHSIDMLFLMVVFLIFTFSALSALLLAVNFYRSTVEKSGENENARVAVAYMREVIRQNDAEHAVTVSEFDGTPCIAAEQEGGYVLYLYLKDGELRELYTKRGANVDIDDGQKIIELENFTLEEAEPGVICVECEDSLGNKERVIIGSRSNAGGQPL